MLAEALEDDTEAVYVVSALLLLIYTGCRLSEILTLRWDYVTSHHLELPDSKTGRRRIPLSREAYDILMDLLRQPDNPYVVLGESNTGSFLKHAQTQAD